MKHKRGKVDIELNKYSDIYEKLTGGIDCPVLKQRVYFTNKGWNHLFVDKKRSKNEILERVRLLPYAKKIISITTTLQEKRFQDFHQHYTFIAFTEGEMGTKIKVTVVEDKKKIYFLSICKV